MNFIDKMVEQFMRVNRRMKRWQRVVSVLAAIVVFVTTYSLVLPAITLDKETASAQAGIEVAASENESGSDGTVYEAEPESEPEAEPAADEAVEEPAAEQTVEEVAEAPAEEDSSSESGSEDAAPAEGEKSEEPAAAPEENTGDNEADHTENTLTAEEAANYATTEEAIAAVTGQTAEEIKLITEQTQLTFDADSYTVYADFDESAKLPEGVKLQVKEITEKSDPAAYQKYYEKALSEVQDKYDENTALSFASFYDIAFVYEGVEIEPSGNVNVRIEYKTAVDVQSDANVEAIHFDKNNGEKAEVIDSDTEGSADKVDAVAFESDQFSVYGVVGTTPGVEIAMTVGETETIEPDLSSYYNRYSWTTSDASVVSIKAGSTSENVTIEAKKEGTAQVVLTYVSGKGKKETSYRAYYQVTVAALNDTDVEAQEYSADGMIVSVEDTGRMKKLSDYHVVVEDADGEFTDAEVLKAYHIYLADAQGNEINAADLGNGTLNLKVTLKYDELPDWFQDAHGVKHYKNGKEQSINAIKFDAENKEISFIVHGFSSFTITSGSTVTTGGGQSITTQQGSILDGMTFDDANEWQIVSEEYTDNASANKIPSDDGRIRVQKNVIPTAVENEFDVYLSVDTSSLYEQYFELATYNAVTQNASHDMTLGVFYDSIVISSSVHVSPTNYSNGPFYVTIKAPDGTVLIQDLKLYWDSSNNFTVYIATSSGYIVIANSIKAGKRYTVTLSKASYEAMQKDVVNNAPQLTSVVDTMGDYIVYDGVVAADGTASINNGVLTWTPAPKTRPEQTITEWTDLNGHSHKVTWNNNVAELVYKCHLDVTKDGFVSGQTYDVNKNAVLRYTGDVSGSVTFPVPQVKGTTYGFELIKTDEAGKPLPGATFTLTGPSNNPDVASSSFTATSNAAGIVSFTGKPIAWGQYSLAETTPPVGYGISKDSPWTLNIGYTTDLEDGTITDHTGDSSTPSVFPGVYIGMQEDGTWEIKDPKNIVTVDKVVSLFGELEDHPEDVDQTVYFVLWDQTDHAYVTGSDGNIIYKKVTITDGQPSAAVTFDEGLKNHTYSVWELHTEPTPGMTTSDIDNITIHVPYDVASTDNGDVELRTINTTVADLTASNSASATVTNIYGYKNGTRSFSARKQWISNNGTGIPAPDGAEVTFTLYRVENKEGGDQTPQAVKSITLDGVKDANASIEVDCELEAWTAYFANLPTVSEDGYSYTYMVKEEKPYPENYLPYLSSNPYASPMGDDDYQKTDGGSIYNRKQTTDITVKKVVDGLASDSNIDFAFTAALPEGTTFPDQADGITTSGNTATFTLKDNETITLTDLPVNVDLSITETNDGTFTTTAEGRTGGTYSNYTYSFTIVDEVGVVTFTNVRATQQVRIFKTGDDLNGAALGGAAFNLSGEEVDLSGLVSIETGTNAGYLPTQAGGTDTVFTLHVGEYALTETEAPANYNKSDDISINVTDQGVTYTVGDGEAITAQMLNDAYTVIVTDTRKKTNITVTKILEDDFSDAAENFVFHTTLMDGYTDITSSIPGLSNFVLTPGTATGKSISFEGIPVGAVLHITETSTGEGELDIENYVTSAEATGAEPSEGTSSRDYSLNVTDTEEDISVTFTNTRKKMDVNLLKVNENGQPLTGASFKLTQVDENGRVVADGIQKESTAVDANGKLTFEGLTAGYYELEETVYPNGYINKSTKNPVFQIVLGEDGNLEVVFENTELVTYDAGTITFTVKNMPGTPLPYTGGSGTLLYTLSGLMLILATALMYGFRMRRRERRIK